LGILFRTSNRRGMAEDEKGSRDGEAAGKEMGIADLAYNLV
jgi:hypothetical protein